MCIVRGDSMTFRMWSFFHFIFIISPFVLAILLYIYTKNLKAETNRKIGIIFSIICIVLLLLRNIEIYINKGYIEPELFPFQICHFANFILLFAFLFKNKTMYTIAFCFNLPFAFLSILFANSLANYQTIISFRGAAYIFGHLLIVAIGLWAYFVDLVQIDMKSLSKGMVFLSVLFVLSVPLNNLFNSIMPGFSNYFYSLKPEGGTPLELAFGWGREIEALGMKFNPIYLLVTLLFGLAIYYAFGGLGYFFKHYRFRKTKIYKTA